MLPPGQPKLSGRDFDPADMDVDEDVDMSSEIAAGGVELSSVEINILIYLYLLESNFSHSAYTLLSESNLAHTSLFRHFNPSYPTAKPHSSSSSKPNGVHSKSSPLTPTFGAVNGKIERGELVRKLYKAVRWEDIERHVTADGEPYKQTCPNPFHLLIPHTCPPNLASSSLNPDKDLIDSLRPSPAPSRPEAFPPPPDQAIAGPSRLRNGHSEMKSAQTQTPDVISTKGKRKTRRNSVALSSSQSRNPSPTRSVSPTTSKKRDKDKKRARLSEEPEDEPRRRGRGRRSIMESEEPEDQPSEMPTPKAGLLSVPDIDSRSKSPINGKKDKASELLRLSAAKGKGNPNWIDQRDIGLFLEHRDQVLCLAWNPKNLGVLASGSGDGTARLWDLDAQPSVPGHALQPTKKSIALSHKSIDTGKKTVNALAWHPDGTILATASQDGVGRLFTPSGQLQGIMSFGRGAVTSLKFSPSGSHILTAKGDSTISLWSAGGGLTGKSLMTWENQQKGINDIDWLDDHVFASGGNDSTIYIYRSNDKNPRYTFKAHTDDVTKVKFAPKPNDPLADPKDRLLASVSDDGLLIIWKLPIYPADKSRASGASSHSPAKGGPGNNFEDVDEMFSNIDSSKYVHRKLDVVGDRANKRMNALAWSPLAKDGRMLIAAGGQDSTVKVYDAESGECLHVLDGLQRGGTGSISFSPLGFGGPMGALAGGGWDAELKIWDVATGAKLKEYEVDENLRISEQRQVPMMLSMEWREDGQHIALGLHNKSIMTIYTGDLAVDSK